MPFRPLLRPGAAIVRRDDAHWQLGTAPGIVIDDRPGLRALLGLLDGVRDVHRVGAIAREVAPQIDDPVALIGELHQRGAVVDANQWPGGVPPGELAHAALNGDDPARLAGRRRLRVSIESDHVCREVAPALRPLLEASGVPVVDADTRSDLRIMACSAEPARGPIATALTASLAHLLIVLDEDRVRVGPLVVPGRTPCLGCFDAERARWDRTWPAMVLQFGRAETRPVGHAVTALGLHAALGLVAADVLAYAEGRPVRTAGARLTQSAGDWSVDAFGFASACPCRLR